MPSNKKYLASSALASLLGSLAQGSLAIEMVNRVKESSPPKWASMNINDISLSDFKSNH